MSKILITGADGFIGSHLTELLVRNGHDVKAFVFYNSFGSLGWLDNSSKEIINNIEIFKGDIRDSNGVRNSVKGCDIIMHLAALIAIPYSYHSPETYIDTNIKGTLNILQAARDFEIQQTIHTSTSEVYGTAKFVPITELHPLNGQSPYSASKIGADQLAISFFSSFELPVTIIRPFNTYGPRQSARAVIPSIITQIANGKKIIELGSTFPTRDFSFIKDTIKGFEKSILCKESFGEVINLGSNFEISILDTFNLIKNLMNSEVQIKSDHQRIRPKSSEVERLYASNKKAKDILNWSPNYGEAEGFRKGLIETIDWFKDKNNLIKYNSEIYNI